MLLAPHTHGAAASAHGRAEIGPRLEVGASVRRIGTTRPPTFTETHGNIQMMKKTGSSEHGWTERPSHLSSLMLPPVLQTMAAQTVKRTTGKTTAKRLTGRGPSGQQRNGVGTPMTQNCGARQAGKIGAANSRRQTTIATMRKPKHLRSPHGATTCGAIILMIATTVTGAVMAISTGVTIGSPTATRIVGHHHPGADGSNGRMTDSALLRWKKKPASRSRPPLKGPTVTVTAVATDFSFLFAQFFSRGEFNQWSINDLYECYESK